MNSFNKCVVVVSSCDKYVDTWYPFFRILKIEWPDCPYPIVLNTESKSFDFEDMGIKTFQFYKTGQKVAWGERMIQTLQQIDSEYIVFLLDDFFMTGKVDQASINECIQWMDNDHNIAVFSFYPTPAPNIQNGKYPSFEKRPQTGEYRLNCQAAVWRREHLLSYIRPHENPWQWEVYGNMRSANYFEEFYSLIEDHPQAFPYNVQKYGLRHGRWEKATVALMEQHNINIDFSKRGFYEPPVADIKASHKNPLLRKCKTLIRLVKQKQLGEYIGDKIAFLRSVAFVK